MELSRNSWHAKVFEWTRASWQWFFTESKYSYKPPRLRSSNRCEYVRTILLWFPLYILIMYAIPIFLFTLVMFVIPSMAVGTGSVLKFWMYVLGYSGGIALTIWAIVKLFKMIPGGWFERKFGPWMESIIIKLQAWQHKRHEKRMNKPEKVSFIEVFGGYINDWHDDLCSIIKFKKEEDDDTVA